MKQAEQKAHNDLVGDDYEKRKPKGREIFLYNKG